MQYKYQMSMIGERSYLLGLQKKKHGEGIFINQGKYTRNLLKIFYLQEYSTTNTPMATATKLDPNVGEPVKITTYIGRIWSLLYLTASWPDILYATYLCAKFQVDPREPHLAVVKRIKCTKNLWLWYKRESYFKLIGYSDANFAGCKINRKSTTRTCQFLGGRLVSRFSKKHE